MRPSPALACLLLALVAICSGFDVHVKVATTAGFTAYRVPLFLNGARSIVIDDSSGDALVLTRGDSAKVQLVRLNPAGNAATSYPLLTTTIDLNHALTIFNGYIYASSDTTVYRWPYNSGSTTPINAAAGQIVVSNMNANGHGGAPQGHTTRTIAINRATSMMYVSVGSDQNLDFDSYRARIRQFSLLTPIPAGGFDFQDPSNVFADGLRNQVALAFDSQLRLWGCETGIDGLGDDNPAEELHVFDGPKGQFFGYPYCYSSFLTPGFPAGTQFAVPGRGQTDDWCRNPANNRAPELAMPAHITPIGLTFYAGQGCNNAGAFPCAWIGDAFIAWHGSWNRAVPNGYQVVRVPFNPATRKPLGGWTMLASQVNFQTECVGSLSSGCWRPVNVAFLRDGRLMISSDASSEVTILAYNGPVPVIPKTSPSPPPSPRPPAILASPPSPPPRPPPPRPSPPVIVATSPSPPPRPPPPRPSPPVIVATSPSPPPRPPPPRPSPPPTTTARPPPPSPSPRPPPPSPPPAACPSPAGLSGTRLAAYNMGGPALCGFSTGDALVAVFGYAFPRQYPGWQTNVYTSTQVTGDATYRFPVTGDRTYTLRLHMVENYWAVAGARTFNVSVGVAMPVPPPSGALGFAKVDPFALAGGKGLPAIRLIDWVAPAGTTSLYLRFVGLTDLATVAAIEFFQRP